MIEISGVVILSRLEGNSNLSSVILSSSEYNSNFSSSYTTEVGR